MIDSLTGAAERLRHLRARRKWWRRWARRAAVAILLREGSAGIEMLMIRRAERAGDPWSGHMAFPGGLVDAADQHTLAAAQRETREEVGLDINAHARLIGRLSELGTPSHRGYRRMLTVSPYVFALHSVPPLQLNHEVAAIEWLPLRFFFDRHNRGTTQWRHLQLPCYTWRGQRIWGLSLQMIDELLHQLAPSSQLNSGASHR